MAALAAERRPHDECYESIQYWKAKQAAKEFLLHEGPLKAPVKDAIKRFLDSSGHGRQLQNLAFALQQRLVLPYEPNAATSTCATCAHMQSRGGDDAEDAAAAGVDAWSPGLPAQPTASTAMAQPQSPTTAHHGAQADDAQAEPEALQWGREQWQSVVVARLMAVKDALGMPLARQQRDPAAVADMRCAGAELASERIGDPEAATASTPAADVPMHVITLGMLHAAVASMRRGVPLDSVLQAASPRGGDSEASTSGGEGDVAPAQGLRLDTPDAKWLQDYFVDMHPRFRQVGADDVMHPWFRSRALAHARAVLDKSSIPVARQFLRRGSPPSCRAQLWDAALSLSHLSYRDTQHFERMCERVEERELLTDALIEKDLACLLDSDNFFLFEEQLRAVLLAFSRDASVTAHAAAVAHPRLVGLGRGGHRHGSYPPNGVVPFEGLALLAAPLMYVHKRTPAVFRALRVLFCRYWSKLFCLSGVGAPSPCMPALAQLFDELLARLEPDLAGHMARLGCPALSVALPWMATAFAGQLPVGEVLLLWDRIIGFDSLMVLPLLAAGILSWRCKTLMQCADAEQIRDVLSEVTELRVVPLLQAVLFMTHT